MRQSSPSILAILSLAALALLVRLWVAAQTALVYPDGAIYLRIARDFAAGELAAGLERIFHPGYPALITAASKLGLPLNERLASLVSATLGVLAALGVMRAAGALDRIARGPAARASLPILAGLWAALHGALAVPAGQVLAYPLSHCALAWASAFTLRGLAGETPRDRAWLFAGGLCGLAFLARPDALLTTCGLGAAATLALLARLPLAPRPPRPLWRRGLILLAFALGFALVAGPYISWVSWRSGRARLTLKKDPEAWLRGADGRASEPSSTRFAELRDAILTHDGPVPAARERGWLEAAGTSLNRATKATGVIIAGLAGLGAFALAQRRAWAALALGAAPSAALLAGHAALRYYAGYLSTLHASYHALFALPLAALGAAGLAAWLDERGLLPTRRERSRAARALLWGALAVIPVAPFFKDVFGPHLAHKVAIRELGEALRARWGRGQVVIGEEVRALAFYAEGRFIDLGEADRRRAEVEAAAREGRAWLALYVRTYEEEVDPALLRRCAELGTPELERREQRGRRRYLWRLYRLHPAP